MESRRLEDGADDVQESVQMDPEIRAYYESGIERAARVLETEPTVVGASAHLLAIGRVR
jgi:hypothetical protein